MPLKRHWAHQTIEDNPEWDIRFKALDEKLKRERQARKEKESLVLPAERLAENPEAADTRSDLLINNATDISNSPVGTADFFDTKVVERTGTAEAQNPIFVGENELINDIAIEVSNALQGCGMALTGLDVEKPLEATELNTSDERAIVEAVCTIGCYL